MAFDSVLPRIAPDSTLSREFRARPFRLLVPLHLAERHMHDPAQRCITPYLLLL